MTTSSSRVRHLLHRSLRRLHALAGAAGIIAPGTDEVVRGCRRIARRPLDDGAGHHPASPAASAAHGYDEIWRTRLDMILRIVTSGEIRLPRVLGEVLRWLEATSKSDLQGGDYVAFNEKVQLPHAAGGYLHRGAVVRTVSELCTADTQSVLELGSGWGEHLCNLWLAGTPRDARYYACELSEPGRKCALVLGALEPAFRLEAPYFDYRAPHFQFVPRPQRELVVYSVHSVEQVRELPPDLIRQLCALADVVKGAHMEPIGWQMIPRDEWNDVTAAHERRCRGKGYNENLWRLLKEAETDGVIAIDTAVPNFFGLEHNPASLIVWHKR